MYVRIIIRTALQGEYMPKPTQTRKHTNEPQAPPTLLRVVEVEFVAQLPEPHCLGLGIVRADVERAIHRLNAEGLV